MLFLATDALPTPTLYANDPTLTSGMLGGLIAVIVGMLVVMLVLGVILWIYTSLAFTSIGKKAKLSSPGIAWIPALGPMIVAYRASKMHWWPWLLIASIVLLVIPILGVVIYVLSMIVLVVYLFIWQWKMFEAVGKPGWWVLLSIIPIVGSIVYLILLGVAAWSRK